MDLTSWIVWAILVIVAAALGFIGFWFSLRTLRLFTFVTSVILAIAVTRLGLTHPEYTSANLVDSFLSGFDQVAIALLHPFWPGKVPAPGVAGRWVIACALLLGYRQLERWALRWQAPELDLSPIGQGGPAATRADRPAEANGHATAAAAATADGLTARQRHAQLAAELRFRLPTMQVRSPAILPGGTRANALASIAETSGISGAGMVSAVVRFAGMFWPSPRSLRVRSWVESEAGTRITVLLEDVKSGQAMATNTITGESFHVAASMVAGYIARQIFAMDRTVPDWCYGMADGRDLGAMQLVRLERAYAACPRDVADSRKVQIDILSSSTGNARTAGIVRYELAQLLALQRQHLESLRLHALNRELHRRFYRGRYRLAMSLEMIANREHHIANAGATLDKLAETLEILSRCELADHDLIADARYLADNGGWEEVTSASGCDAPCVRVSPSLARKLLKIAANDLREVRSQLSLWHVVRDALVRRDERAVWLPHWRQRHRQPFRDGVCVAELLIAIRCRLLDPGDENPGWLGRKRVRWHLRRATGITSFIAGDPGHINAVLTDPSGHWWEKCAPETGASDRRRTHAPDRIRWLPWQRRTASWQAAYNTACLYAALTDAAFAAGAPTQVLRELEQRVIDSLRRAVENPSSELEHPSDWFDSDPDFHAMCHNSRTFKAFGTFLLEQQRQDYPVAFMTGKCPVPHTSAAMPTGRVTKEKEESPVLSPPQSPVPRVRLGADGPLVGGA